MPLDIIILGAGPAGISAGRYLSKNHPEINYLVFEARDRVGGRAHSIADADFGYFDQGAKWIHGPSRKNPMVKLAEESGFLINHWNDGDFKSEHRFSSSDKTNSESTSNSRPTIFSRFFQEYTNEWLENSVKNLKDDKTIH